MMRVRKFLRRVIDIVGRPYMRILPGQLAFFFVLSLIPLVALIGAIFNGLSLNLDPSSTIMNLLPFDITDLVGNSVSSKTVGFNLIVFLFSAFLLASNGTHSVIITSNEIYGVKSRNVIQRRLKAIVMIMILVLLILFLFLVPIFGDSIMDVLKDNFGDSSLFSFLLFLYNVIKYPLSVFLIYINIKLLYTIAPDMKIDSKTTTFGALFTTIVWAIGTEVYSVYVRLFSNYDVFYGSISNIVILLLWVYFLSYVFVLGIAMNVSGESVDVKK